MTEIYAIAEKQRDEWLAIMRNNPQDPEAYDAITELESLPLITGEPVAYMLHTSDSEEIGGLAPLPSKRELLEIGQQGAEVIPLYTHPQQPLQPITADDVTDEMYNEWQKVFGESITYCPKDSEIMAAAYNAVIKHRSKAK